jgi:hypothetical protein
MRRRSPRLARRRAATDRREVGNSAGEAPYDDGTDDDEEAKEETNCEPIGTNGDELAKVRGDSIGEEPV